MNKTRFIRTVVAALMLCLGLAARGQVTLAWNPVAGAVTNYTVFWGTNSGVYVFSAFVGTQTNLLVTGLTPGQVYYFAVNATASDGTESPFSSEIDYTNLLGSVSTSTNGGGNLGNGNSSTNPVPPIPPVVDGGSNNVSGSNNIVNGTNSGPSNPPPPASNVVSTSTSEYPVAGVPPVLSLNWTNDATGTRPLMGIAGTVGAYLWVQSTTNMADPDSWTTITNLPITVAATNVATNSGAPSLLTTALAPAAQSYEVMDTNPPPGEFYRVVMPYDYMVLAGGVLNGAGYPSRLVLVRMPGVPSDDVCYVAPQNSFLFYDAVNNAFAVVPSSGATIRQIATTLAGTLGQNWTSAAEFSFSNGVSTVMATVVETESPSSDPLPGAPSSTISIDF